MADWLAIAFYGVSLALLAYLAWRQTRNRVEAPLVADPRLGEVLQKLSALDERTKGWSELEKDVAALKDRTNELPQKIQKLDTQTQPIGGVATQLAMLPKIDRQLDELHGAFRSTKGRGDIGEGAVREILRQFPEDAWAEKPQLTSGTPDFGVRTPNRLLVPVDSKTGGAEEMKRFLDALDAEEAARAVGDAAALEATSTAVRQSRRSINEKVRKDGRNIRKYIMPEAGTTPFVLQALPDAVFDALEAKTRLDSAEEGVLPVPYSLLQPIASLVRRLESHGEIDVTKLAGAVSKVQDATKAIEATVKNSVERAATMATNAAQEIRGQLDGIRATLLTLEAMGETKAAPVPITVKGAE